MFVEFLLLIRLKEFGQLKLKYSNCKFKLSLKKNIIFCLKMCGLPNSDSSDSMERFQQIIINLSNHYKYLEWGSFNTIVHLYHNGVVYVYII